MKDNRTSTRKKIRIKKIVIPVLIACGLGWLASLFRSPSVQAADIASGISAIIAIAVGFVVLYPRLDYLFLPRQTRKSHKKQLQHVMTLVSRAFVVFSGRAGNPGDRTGALVMVYITSRALPNVPPSALDSHFDMPKEINTELAQLKEAVEETIGARGLENPRLIYQTNLFNALGELVKGAAFELGGHGFVTETWERNLVEWSMCALKQHQALRNPLGPPASEDQLLQLLDRLISADISGHLVEPLKKGHPVRIQNDHGEWIGPHKLISNPVLVDRLDTGMPVWKLAITDREGAKKSFRRDRTGFEPAPGE